jgi:hypothetical protein
MYVSNVVLKFYMICCSIVSFFIGIIFKTVMKCLYKSGKPSNKVMTTSFFMNTFKQANWSASALNIVDMIQ